MCVILCKYLIPNIPQMRCSNKHSRHFGIGRFRLKLPFRPFGPFSTWQTAENGRYFSAKI